jgi:hypothetical protein
MQFPDLGLPYRLVGEIFASISFSSLTQLFHLTELAMLIERCVTMYVDLP